jgi:hypothetical protein
MVVDAGRLALRSEVLVMLRGLIGVGRRRDAVLFQQEDERFLSALAAATPDVAGWDDDTLVFEPCS